MNNLKIYKYSIEIRIFDSEHDRCTTASSRANHKILSKFKNAYNILRSPSIRTTMCIGRKKQNRLGEH